MTKKFITIKEDSYDEFVEKKSTFITHLIRINSEEEARDFIQKMKKKHYDATHVCSCYVVGDNIDRIGIIYSLLCKQDYVFK